MVFTAELSPFCSVGDNSLLHTKHPRSIVYQPHVFLLFHTFPILLVFVVSLRSICPTQFPRQAYCPLPLHIHAFVGFVFTYVLCFIFVFFSPRFSFFFLSYRVRPILFSLFVLTCSSVWFVFTQNVFFSMCFCYSWVSYRVRNYQAKKAYLTSSARILVLEARDILDYALVLLEPPPPDMLEFGPTAAPPPAGAEGREIQVRSTWHVFAYFRSWLFFHSFSFVLGFFCMFFSLCSVSCLSLLFVVFSCLCVAFFSFSRVVPIRCRFSVTRVPSVVYSVNIITTDLIF